MIISEGHARALLRSLVREHSARARATTKAVGAALCALPDKRSRLADFVEAVRSQLAKMRCSSMRAATSAVLRSMLSSLNSPNRRPAG